MVETNEVAMTRASVATDFIMVLEADDDDDDVVALVVVVEAERRMVGRNE